MPQGATRPDQIRVEEMSDWSRVSGDSICDICGCKYFEHQRVPGYSWLRKLCDGELVKT